jgi:hypothetical protein
MSAWIVHCGKRYMGRLLARSKKEAESTAADFWGRHQTYIIKPVKRR